MKKTLMNKVIKPAVLIGGLAIGVSGCAGFYDDPACDVAFGSMPRWSQPGAYRDLQDEKVRRKYEKERNDTTDGVRQGYKPGDTYTSPSGNAVWTKEDSGYWSSIVRHTDGKLYKTNGLETDADIYNFSRNSGIQVVSREQKINNIMKQYEPGNSCFSSDGETVWVKQHSGHWRAMVLQGEGKKVVRTNILKTDADIYNFSKETKSPIMKTYIEEE